MSFFLLFDWVVVGTVKPIQVSPVELVDYLLGDVIYSLNISDKILSVNPTVPGKP